MGVEAGKITGEEVALKTALESLEEFIKIEVDKACEEAAAAKGQQIFGDFGAKVGVESGLIAGRKAALEKARHMVLELGAEEGRQAGAVAAEKIGQEMVSKQNMKEIRKEKVSELRTLFTESGTT